MTASIMEEFAPILSVVFKGDGTANAAGPTGYYYAMKPGFTYAVQVSNLTAKPITVYTCKGTSWNSRVEIASVGPESTKHVPAAPALQEDKLHLRIAASASLDADDRIEVMLIGRPIATT